MPRALADLTVGEECWVLNGHRSRVFLCKVFYVDHPNRVIMVKNVDKENRLQSFRFDGSPVLGEEAAWDPKRAPVGDAPKLVMSDDLEALRLEEEAMQRQFKERIREAATELPDSSAFDRLRAILAEWEQMSLDN